MLGLNTCQLSKQLHDFFWFFNTSDLRNLKANMETMYSAEEGVDEAAKYKYLTLLFSNENSPPFIDENEEQGFVTDENLLAYELMAKAVNSELLSRVNNGLITSFKSRHPGVVFTGPATSLRMARVLKDYVLADVETAFKRKKKINADKYLKNFAFPNMDYLRELDEKYFKIVANYGDMEMEERAAEDYAAQSNLYGISKLADFCCSDYIASKTQPETEM